MVKRPPRRSPVGTQAAAARSPKGTVAARSRPTIFISYRHESPTAEIAQKLRLALLPPAAAWNADLFMDSQSIEPGTLFDPQIIAALDRTTHFIVLLTNAYWNSPYCRKELERAMRRFGKDGSVVPLFVKAEELDPKYFILAPDSRSGRIRGGEPVIRKIGDVQFLGPFNEQWQLVRLKWEQPAALGDQIAQLIKRLEPLIER
jgi:hypothetical protein